MVDGDQSVTLLWDGEPLQGAGSFFEGTHSATLPSLFGAAQTVCWTQRVKVVRSLSLAQTQHAGLEKGLTAGMAAVSALTPAPGRGKRPIRDETPLKEAIQAVLLRGDVVGLLTVTRERVQATVTPYCGRGRGGAKRPTDTQTPVHYRIRQVQRDDVAITARCHRLG